MPGTNTPMFTHSVFKVVLGRAILNWCFGPDQNKLKKGNPTYYFVPFDTSNTKYVIVSKTYLPIWKGQELLLVQGAWLEKRVTIFSQQEAYKYVQKVHFPV